MHKYKDLKVWQKAVELTTLIYKETSMFPIEEKFGITNQIRRASGSCYETETQLIIACNLKYLNEPVEIFNLIEEIQKMLFAFSNKLKDT